MKVLIFPFIFLITILLIYIYSIIQKKRNKKNNIFFVSAILSIALALLTVGGIKMYEASTTPDTQCSQTHKATSSPPLQLTSANDLFAQGNYDYETGDCGKAIVDYTLALNLNPNFPEAFNNRAYTYMRMQNYSSAMVDLNEALKLRPNYINALMNQGDLYNYYGPVIDKKKAIENYNKVIALGGTDKSSVCGHKAMAESNGFLPYAFLRLITNSGCQ